MGDRASFASTVGARARTHTHTHTHTRKGGVTDEKKFYGVDTRWTDADADTANTMQNTDSAENKVEKVVNKSRMIKLLQS